MTKRFFSVVRGVLLGCVCACYARAEAAQVEQFKNPEDAVSALLAAVEGSDKGRLDALFGRANRGLFESGDPVSDRNGRQQFLDLYRRGHTLEQRGAQTVMVLGDEKWPFPVPLVEAGGRWHFNAAAGKEEMINRRIGGNELETIEFCRAYVRMQQEYYSQDRDGDGFQEYARKFLSDRGRKNGLFWFRRPGEAASPLGPIAVQAFAEGYLRNMDGKPQPYHGYYFRILTAQGAQAPGGKKNYIEYGGRMTGGFALLAYPAKWGVSGIMSFVVGEDGRVFEKDLGPRSQALAAVIEDFNPDSSWRLVEEH